MFAKKKYGQNFLNNEQIIKDIVNEINPNNDDLIIEIGPGRGALTRYLSEKKCNVLCIEIDTDMKQYLNKYESNHLKVLYKDILDVNLREILKNYSFKKLYILGNLPYYITSPILTYLIESEINPDSMVFMVQDEVAKRFTSIPGNSNYGYMTVYLNNYFNTIYEFFVSRKNFNPIPNVDSAVIKLIKKDIDIPNGYFDFLKECFSLKRKTLRNNLKRYDWNIISDILKINSISDTVRAEELSDKILKEIYFSLKENQ